MRPQQLEAVFTEFEDIYLDCLAHPPHQECCCHEEQGIDYCICNPLPTEIEAFDSAVCWLNIEREERGQRGLSIEEMAAFVNTRGKNVLREYDIRYEPSGGAHMVHYELKLNPERTDAAPSGITLALWTVLEKLLPERVREATLGDLEEIFADIHQRKGENGARVWLLRQCLWSLRDALYIAFVDVVIVCAVTHFKTWVLHLLERLFG